jgi:ABC-type nitrate/sulfonate/bicarbonate transport system permease component
MMNDRSSVSRTHKLKKFVTDGAGRLIIFMTCAVLLWAFFSVFIIERPDRYLPSPLAVILSSADMIYKGSLLSYYSDTLTRLILEA